MSRSEVAANPILQVYYDGLCHLCSHEIDHYRKLPGSEKIQFVDITDPNFDAKKEHLNPFLVHQVMHAKTSDGKILTKVDAFVEIWKLIPKYHWAAKLVQNSFLRSILNIFYIIFARGIRPYLPKKKKSCEDSPYCDSSKKPF